MPIEMQMLLEQEQKRTGKNTNTAGKSKVAAIKVKVEKEDHVHASEDERRKIEGLKRSGGHNNKALWKCGVNRFKADFLIEVCEQIARERVNDMAGTLVKTMLSICDRTSQGKNWPISSAVRGVELHSELTTVLQVQDPDMKPFPLDMMKTYLKVMKMDKASIVTSKRDSIDPTNGQSDGGQYSVNVKSCIEFLRLKTIESILKEKYDKASNRVFHTLRTKGQMESKQLGELAMVGSPTEARKLLYRMLRDGLVQVQEIPKRNDYNPQQTIYCWSVDTGILCKVLQTQLMKSFILLRARRNTEYTQNRDIIARSNFITSTDKNEMSKIEEVQRALDRLDQALCRLSKTLLILQSTEDGGVGAV